MTGAFALRPLDLIAVAERLLSTPKGKPSEASLRRAQSTVYYAIFHCLASQCADMFMGGNGARRSGAAWRQTYRALEHGPAKNACRDQNIMRKFPKEVEDFANAFATLQERRHAADYDPQLQLRKSSVRADIELAKRAISDFADTKAKDRRAFAAHVLLKKRA